MFFDDRDIPESFDNVQIVRRVGRRQITHAFHDVDGTHSLIRDWPPVMSLVLHEVIVNGLPQGYDSPAMAQRLVAKVGRAKLEETDRFCIESAGLSALTQMEWAIRRAIAEGSIPAALMGLSPEAKLRNRQITQRIWMGEEIFDHISEPPSLRAFLKHHTPRLFQLYERVLNGACRDRNTVAARQNPSAWRVPGSMEFMRHLQSHGVRNYFVTGAVVQPDAQGRLSGGMYEEVLAVGFELGAGKLVESLEGSTWSEKIPKDEVMRRLCSRMNIAPQCVLVVGDGRSEVAAGKQMGAVVISRLPCDAQRQRELHRELGTNLILADYTSPHLMSMLQA